MSAPEKEETTSTVSLPDYDFRIAQAAFPMGGNRLPFVVSRFQMRVTEEFCVSIINGSASYSDGRHSAGDQYTDPLGLDGVGSNTVELAIFRHSDGRLEKLSNGNSTAGHLSRQDVVNVILELSCGVHPSLINLPGRS